MFGILFIYFIGKYFYELAVKFNRNKWLFAILGVVVYYAGSAIGGIIIGIAAVLLGFDIENANTTALGLLTIPFGIATDYLFYYLLRKNWERNAFLIKDEIQEIGTTQE